MASSDKDLMRALSGGKGGPKWAKPVALVLTLAFAWILSWELGLFLVLLLSGGYVVWSWMREKGNIVDSLANWVFLIALLATPLAIAINATADGFKSFGPASVEAVKKRWNDSRSSVPGVQITPAETTTTTAPPAPPEAIAQGPR